MLMDSLRGTGRTTRMLQFAIDKAVAGERWIVVGRRERDAERLWRQCYQMLYDAGTPHRVARLQIDCGKGFIAFEGTQHLEWRDFCLRGHDPLRVLIDHAAIEAEFQVAIAKVHQFDDPKVCAIIDQAKTVHKAAKGA